MTMAMPQPLTHTTPTQLGQVWWMPADGGSEARRLAADTGLGVHANTWPAPAQCEAGTEVVLVCQATSEGMMAAARALDIWVARGQPVPVRGLVAVARQDAVPCIVSDWLALLARWVPVWRMGWGAESVTDPAQTLDHSDVEALRYFVLTRAKTTTTTKAARLLTLLHHAGHQ